MTAAMSSRDIRPCDLCGKKLCHTGLPLFWGTALKPALEPIVLARKPLDGTVAENVLAHGTGALNVDGCRISAPDGVPKFSQKGKDAKHAYGDGLHGSARTGAMDTSTGRWPANVIHDGSDEVVALFPADAGAFAPVRGTEPSSSTKAVFGQINRQAANAFHGDSGSAARFFYTAKVSPSERGRDNTHPTVKPLDLMRYLCKLVTPPGGLILDPFIGSGSTAIAAAQLDMHAVCIDLEAEHVEIAANRIRDTLGMLAELRRHERAA